MENERKEYKEKKPFDKQIFYFNDKGQLVVESNKGVWVDGEKFVKMYGDFVCNAKTLGIIIENFKGFRVLVAKYLDDRYVAEIVNPTDIEKSYNNEVSYLQEQIDKDNDKIYELKKSIDNYNHLPWWQRIFKKIELK
jgi:hypothetical protein